MVKSCSKNMIVQRHHVPKICQVMNGFVINTCCRCKTAKIWDFSPRYQKSFGTMGKQKFPSKYWNYHSWDLLFYNNLPQAIRHLLIVWVIETDGLKMINLSILCKFSVIVVTSEWESILFFNFVSPKRLAMLLDTW